MSHDANYYIAPRCDEPLRVLHVDEDLVVVEKPAFLYTVPGRGPENTDSVLTRLLTRFADPVVVHRLDLDTSGLLVIALSVRARQELSRQIRERMMKKIYQAVVWGLVKESKGVIDLPIGKDWENRPRCKIDYESGKKSFTRYQVLSRNTEKNTTVLRLEPETGRQHQLRLHLASINHPIIGCDLYAHEEALNASSRLMLHASELGFFHPADNNWMSWRSDFL